MGSDASVELGLPGPSLYVRNIILGHNEEAWNR